MYEYFEDKPNERRYYFRGVYAPCYYMTHYNMYPLSSQSNIPIGCCIRCRRSTAPHVMLCGRGSVAYSLNLCDKCMMYTAGVTRLRGNGDRIYTINCDQPKIFYCDMKKLANREDREATITERAEEAYLGALHSAKLRYHYNNYSNK